MKIGVKTYYGEAFLRNFEKKADFFEIMAVEGKDYTFLKKFSNPIVVHAEHQTFGINLADKTKEKQNLSALNFARKIADFSRAKKIILHAGALENKNCSKKNALALIKSLDKRMPIKNILIENLPHLPHINYFSTTPAEIEKLIKEAGVGFCLDINHAIVTAISLKKDYISFLEEFIKLEPQHYHLGGQRIRARKDAHIALKHSEIDIKEILALLPENAEVTLETEPDINKTENDLKIIKKTLQNLGKM